MPTVDRRSALRVEIPCSLHAAREAGRALRAFLAECALTEPELEGWELATVEAANNAVIFTPADRRQLPVVLEATASVGQVEVRITDHTDGFEFPRKVELPEANSEHGRGLYLLQALADSIEYLRGRDSNCLILSRKRQEPAPLRPQGQPEQLEAELALMTEELAASYESLSAIFNFTTTLCQAEEPLDLVVPWMKELSRITGADWHAFYILTPDGRALHRAAADGAEIPAVINVANAGDEKFVAPGAVKSRQDLWFDPEMTVAPDDPLAKAMRGTSGLLHPVFLGAALVGLAAVGRRAGEHPFTAGQVNVIHTFADFLGSQVRYGQVRRDITRSQVMLRELEIAAGIQQSLLPSILPQSPRFDIAGFATSAHEVGGDFYDVIGLDEGSVLVVIADVMGKGVPAALFAAILRAIIRSRRDLASNPGKLLRWLNETLFPDFDRVDMFATVQLAYIDSANLTLRAATAGHCPLLVASSDGTIAELGAEGLPIGTQSGGDFPDCTVPITPGARILLYTDGLIEAKNAQSELWGLSQLRHWLYGTVGSRQTAQEIGISLKAELDRFRGGSPVTDDVTFVVLSAH